MDGDLDLFGSGPGGEVAYARNDGGVFVRVAPGDEPMLPGSYWTGPGLFFDFDGDGDLDMLAGDGSSAFYRNNDQFLVRLEPDDVTSPIYGTQIVGASDSPAVYFVDFDGDGDLDTFQGSTYYEFTNGHFAEKSGTAAPFDGIDIIVDLRGRI